MDLKHEFEIPTNLEHAWKVMLDVPRIAPCLPGAELTEGIDEHNFKLPSELDRWRSNLPARRN